MAKKSMKIDISKVIFTEKSRLTFDGQDGGDKGRFLSKSDVRVFKRK